MDGWTRINRWCVITIINPNNTNNPNKYNSPKSPNHPNIPNNSSNRNLSWACVRVRVRVCVYVCAVRRGSNMDKWARANSW